MASENDRDTKRDSEPGTMAAHPIATGVGGLGGTAAGAAVGSMAGPGGAVVGGVVGAVGGGLAGMGIAAAIDPAVEGSYWRSNFSSRPYASGQSYETYQPASAPGTSFRATGPYPRGRDRRVSRFSNLILFSGAVLSAGCAKTAARSASADSTGATASGTASGELGAEAVTAGREIFRFDTFGNEVFWTDTLRLHEVVASAVDPTTALKVGLKVDADVLPAGILQTADLKSPATTVALLKLNAVVGLKAEVDAANRLVRLGITCALCHSTVDNSVSPGIGRRMDGWPNRDLNVGAIIALSGAVPADQKAVYQSWGPGKYDPRFNLDGKSTPLVLPPAYGLAQIKNETYTAEGPLSYWNAYVAVTQMHGRGNFTDSRLGIDIKHSPDLVGPKLASLGAYQHSLSAPPAPAGSFDPVMAERGRAVFDANCARCHVGTNGTDNNAGTLHQAGETGMDGAYAARTATKAYRTTPLRGLWQHPPYFHDGSAATLAAVVAHYNRVLALKLPGDGQRDLVEYLKSQ